jgi:putative oxidoreductase
MEWLRLISAVLLALPLLVFGSNYFLHFFPMPPGDGSSGDRLLQAMREGGLMSFIAFSHVVVGVLLLVPQTRFPGAILQLPISIGIVSFHISMQPRGLPPGLIMLLLNLGAVADPVHLRGLFM